MIFAPNLEGLIRFFVVLALPCLQIPWILIIHVAPSSFSCLWSHLSISAHDDQCYQNREFPKHGKRCTNLRIPMGFSPSFCIFKLQPTKLAFCLSNSSDDGQDHFVPTKLRINTWLHITWDGLCNLPCNKWRLPKMAQLCLNSAQKCFTKQSLQTYSCLSILCFKVYIVIPSTRTTIASIYTMMCVNILTIYIGTHMSTCISPHQLHWTTTIHHRSAWSLAFLNTFEPS